MTVRPMTVRPFTGLFPLSGLLSSVLMGAAASGCSTSLISSDATSLGETGALPVLSGPPAVGVPPLPPTVPPTDGSTAGAPVVVPVPTPGGGENVVSALGSTVGALGGVVGSLGDGAGPLSPVLSPLTTPIESLIQGVGSQVELLGLGLFSPASLSSQQILESPLAQIGTSLSGVVGGVTGVTQGLGDGLGVGRPVAGLLYGVGGGVDALGSALQSTGIPIVGPLGGVVSGLGGVVGSLGGVLTGTPIPSLSSANNGGSAAVPSIQAPPPSTGQPLGNLLGGVVRGVGGLVGGLLQGVGGLLSGGSNVPSNSPR